MPFISIPYISLLLAIAIITNTAQATNLWKEQEIRRDITQIVASQHIVELDAGKRNTVLALYTASRKLDSAGGVVILHDFGHHPNWPRISGPLREQLPDAGWHTLSVQMPIPDAMWQFDRHQDILDETINRIKSAIDYLTTRNVAHLVLIAHGESAALASHYLSNTPHPFKAFVAISIAHDDASEDWSNTGSSLKKMNVPMLDIFAEHDLPEVLKFAPMRLVAARVFRGNLDRAAPPIPFSRKVRQLAKNKTNNLWYRQIIIPSAHPGFPVTQDILVKNIRGWLEHYARQ